MKNARNAEPQANYELARALRRRNPDWSSDTCAAEQSRVIQQSADNSGLAKRPDIVVSPSRRQPVIIETEFAPARTVERDAAVRLGTQLHSTGAGIEGALAVVLPEKLRTANLETIDSAEFRYATHYLDAKGNDTRWPQQGWLTGNVDDLADAIEHLSLSERQLYAGTAALETVVRNAAALLAEYSGEPALSRIATKLHQRAGEQTERMAAAIFVSAFVFHSAIDKQDGIPPVPLAGSIDKGNLLRTWDTILAMNYWPIFSTARELVWELPLVAVAEVMDRIAEWIPKLARLGTTTYHDLTGRMFQTLITDRKFLASFYTLPTSACLLAELAADRLQVKWSDRAAIQRLRIADFACGTGALLSAAQRAIYRRCRRAGLDDKTLHAAMMERGLTGLDIMPAATHLTCSMLSSAHPSLEYGQSQIHTMPYGNKGGKTHIGALDLLDSEHSYSLFATGESIGSKETESHREHSVMIKNTSYDLVIMNPPFTRPLGHEGVVEGVPISSFAGFRTAADEQREMASKLKMYRAKFGHGYAGLASNFMDLAHRKLKDGGILALVLPFTFTQGKSWEKSRLALHANYSDIHLLSIANTGSTERAFSADTGMAECLLLATKKAENNGRTLFSSLDARPAFLLDASITAKSVKKLASQGSILNAGAAGVRSSDIITTAQNLQESRLFLPRQSKPLALPMVRLGKVAKRGFYSMNIGRLIPCDKRTIVSKAPFWIRSLRQGEVPTWPALWNHDAKRERKLVVDIDTCAEIQDGYEKKAENVWDSTASKLHINQDFRLNSQSTSMCFTSEKCLGGRAWPNIIPVDSHHEIPLLLWCNSVLGLIMYWWYSTRQQAGRSMLKISAVPSLPVLDIRTLTDDQTDHCHRIFEAYREREFLPANEAYRDETRMSLDRELLFGSASVLQLDSHLETGLDLLRRKWCAEPSVHGGKSTRIRL
ncbi:MAG: hypothetical protein OXD30_06325 [Bryobacterales bacterium]|nr:hypothetical protein [Bryobacterales bacterium]